MPNLQKAIEAGLRRYVESARGRRLLGARCTISHPEKGIIKVKCDGEVFLVSIKRLE
jgi:hypothetical protein